MIDRQKYIVFNRNKMVSILTEESVSAFNIAAIANTEIADAIVIRKGDTFAASALYAYATSVLSAVEILRDVRNGAVVGEDIIEHLTELADYFAVQADHARQLNGRIPD